MDNNLNSCALEVLQDPFDDDFCCGGNVVPWSQSDVLRETTAEKTASFNLFEVTNLDSTTLTEFQAMAMDQLTYSDHTDLETRSRAKKHTAEEQEDPIFPFLDLPFEIRHQIYHWVHLMHPIKQAQLTPWYPTPVYSTYFLRIVCPYLGPSVCEYDGPIFEQPASTAPSRAADENDSAPLLSPHRPMAGIPSRLLRANRQIYQEARDISLSENEFVFVNWFASGLWAARSFTKGLQPWQQEKMRYVRLELLARDLAGNYAEEWQELCGLWACGIRGLRLKIMSGGGAFGSWVAENMPEKGAPLLEVRDCHGKLQHWVESGLRSMTQLRHLEVELVITDWDSERKLRWCIELEEALADAVDSSHNVRVICVEKSGQ